MSWLSKATGINLNLKKAIPGVDKAAWRAMLSALSADDLRKLIAEAQAELAKKTDTTDPRREAPV